MSKRDDDGYAAFQQLEDQRLDAVRRFRNANKKRRVSK